MIPGDAQHSQRSFQSIQLFHNISALGNGPVHQITAQQNHIRLKRIDLSNHFPHFFSFCHVIYMQVSDKSRLHAIRFFRNLRMFNDTAVHPGGQSSQHKAASAQKGCTNSDPQIDLVPKNLIFAAPKETYRFAQKQ